MALTALNVAAPVVNPQGGPLVTGTLVWNTNTAGAIPNNVVPGMYYWDGAKWISLAGSPGGLDWSLSGNTGTNPATNYVGTTDNVPLILRANSIERIRMGTAETVINEDAQNYDFRVEGTGEPEMFFVDASTNHVHIRAASPFPTIDMFTSVGSQTTTRLTDMHQDKEMQQYTDSTLQQQQQEAQTLPLELLMPQEAYILHNQIGTLAWSAQEMKLVPMEVPIPRSGSRQGGYFTNSDGTNIQATASLAGYDNANAMYYGGYFDGGQYSVGGIIENPAGDINGRYQHH